MRPNRWTSEDEELWHAYACAALAGATKGRDGDPTVIAADFADRLLEHHRGRFPRPERHPLSGTHAILRK